MSGNQTMESSQSDGPTDRFVYFAEIPKLQEIASHQVALAIRYNDHSKRFFDPEVFTYTPLFEMEYLQYDIQVESLRIPSVIKGMIKNCMEKIEKELCIWLKHFNHILYGLSRAPYKVRSADVQWCVWLPNGEIDYLKTGTKMLKSEKLSQRQKFLIMCEYCMEDEIKKVSLDTLPTDYIGNTDCYNDDGILLYWLRFLKNTLHEAPLENHVSPEAVMARNFHLYARFAVEYFWNRIGIDDQFTVISEWIESRCNTRFECAVVERLISAISWTQQQCLLEQKSVRMVVNFSLHSSSTRCALWAWEYCKKEMPEEQFAQIVEVMLAQWTRERHPCPALIEIWETADDHHRNFVMRTMPNTVIDMCLFRYHNPGNAFEFVIRFFRLIPLEERKKIIFEQTAKIRSYFFDLSSFNEILDICLPCPDDRLMFIKSVIKSYGMKMCFFEFLRARDFEKIDALLGYYFCHDVEGAREFKKKLLKSIIFERDFNIDFVCNIDEWNKYADYIDEIFSNDPWQALAEKQRIVKLAITSDLYRYEFYLHHDVWETLKIIELVFANEELKSIKGEFARCFGESLKTRNYWENEKFLDETYFQRIIDWCLGDDKNAILKFKKQVSQDTIFDRIFYRIYKWYETPATNTDYLEAILERLNMYLNWYLASDDQVKMFKLRRLNASFKELKIFKLISNRKDGHFLDILLKWFFDGDYEQMQRFRLENFQF